LLSLSQADIAAATGLSLPTIKRAESQRNVQISTGAIAAIVAALEALGVEFLAENGDGPGVRLIKGAKGDPNASLGVDDLNAGAGARTAMAKRTAPTRGDP
jgi:transcriptional regulator with XRE-family HTH domain